MGLKLIGFGPLGFSLINVKRNNHIVLDYARDVLNLFDAMIVVISLLEATLLTNSGTKAVSAFRSARVLRAFRVLRVTRLLRVLAFMKVIIGVISRTLKSFISVAVLIILMLFIYTLLGMQLLGGNLNTQTSRSNFDSFFQALLASYQVMITENWNSVLQSVFASSSMNNWVGSIYLISWVILGNWILLNLFLAIILHEFTTPESKRDQREAEEELNHEEFDDPYLSSIYRSMNTGGSNASLLSHQKSINTIRGTNMSLHHSHRNSNLKISTNNYQKSIERGLSSYDSMLGDEEGKTKPLYHGVHCEDSIFFFEKNNRIRIFCYKVITFKHFETVVMSVIFASSLTLAVATYFAESTAAFDVIDDCYNIFFCIEMVLKIISLGFIVDKGSYLRDSWNQLDFFIVIVSLIDMSFPSVNIAFFKVRGHCFLC